MDEAERQESDAPNADTHAPTSDHRSYHTPVLLAEVLSGLAPVRGGRYIDGTLGGGGHSAALLSASAPDGELLGIDADPEAIAEAGARLSGAGSRATLARGNFRTLEQIAHAHGFVGVDGILLDLGVSSHQLDTPARGFSFQEDGPLDMRLDPEGETSAADLVNEASEAELADIIYHYGEERGARRVARFIAEARRKATIETTSELAAIVARALGGRRGRIHPATRTFQALRIAANGELESLEQALPQAVELLRPGGRVAVIAFHSLEDRIVKRFFRAEQERGRVTILTKKPLEASDDEAARNPRSRSAKLRVAQRV